jgi:aminoglycoside phosphotransferase (APT) family kinase protein
MTPPSPPQFALAVAEHLGARVSDAEEIAGRGAVNHVFVIPHRRERWVIRFPRDPLEVNHFEKEAWCLKAAARAGLPVPEVLAIGELSGTPYLVQTFVAGVSASGQSSLSLWRTLGGYARRVHDIPLDASAPEALLPRFGRDPARNWAAHIDYSVGQLSADDPLIGLGVYSPEMRSRLGEVFESLRSRVGRFGLTHGDLVPGNVLLPADGPPVLLDWGCAVVGPVPHGDCLLVWEDPRFSREELAAFTEGCGVPLEPMLGTLADLRLLGAIDLVRWALDKRPDRLGEICEKARQVVSQATASLGDTR